MWREERVLREDITDDGNLSKDLKGVRSFLKGARQAVERTVQVE